MERKALWTLVVTSVSLCIVVLDNLVVVTALPAIRVDLHATVEQLPNRVEGAFGPLTERVTALHKRMETAAGGLRSVPFPSD